MHRILLIDSEPARDLPEIAETLRAVGHEVTTVRSPAEALDALAGSETPFVIVGLAEDPGRAELLARLCNGSDEERFGSVVVRRSSRSVLRDGRPVPLTPMEYELLAALLRRRGGVATRSELLEEVWAYRPGVQTRTVDIHVAALRRKLESTPARPRHILTVRKAGYRLAR